MEDSLTPSTSKTFNTHPTPQFQQRSAFDDNNHAHENANSLLLCVCYFMITTSFWYLISQIAMCVYVCVFLTCYFLILWQPFLGMCLAGLHCPVEMSCGTGSWWMCEYEHGGFQLQGKKKESLREWVFATEERFPTVQVAETDFKCSSLQLTGLIQTYQPWIHIY